MHKLKIIIITSICKQNKIDNGVIRRAAHKIYHVVRCFLPFISLSRLKIKVKFTQNKPTKARGRGKVDV